MCTYKYISMHTAQDCRISLIKIYIVALRAMFIRGAWRAMRQARQAPRMNIARSAGPLEMLKP